MAQALPVRTDLMPHVTAFADAVRSSNDLSITVPTCPEWTLHDLARHLGRVHRRVVATVTSGADRMLPRDAEIPDGEPPTDRDDLAAWVLAGGAGLVDALHTAGPDTLVGGFTGPVPVSFWERRQLHETLVHRLDAEIAVGITPLAGVSAELAADGIGEWYDLLSLFRAGSRKVRGEGTVGLHATDAAAGWLIRRGPDGVTITEQHGAAEPTGDATAAGPAAALLAVVTGRRALDAPADSLGAVEVRGDREALADWLRVSALL